MSIFDKTGTLTRGTPQLVDGDRIDRPTLAVAAAMAAHSRHPYSLGPGGRRAARQDADRSHWPICANIPGQASKAASATGSIGWAGPNGPCPTARRREWDGPSVVLSENGRLLAASISRTSCAPAPGKPSECWRRATCRVEILSGDRDEAVRRLALSLGVPHVAEMSRRATRSPVSPRSPRQGRKALMVGDGLNDAPALAAAHVSMAPASAADVGRNAADFVFLRESLTAVPQAIDIAREAGSPGPPEPAARRRLQRDRGSGCDPGPGDALARRHRDVAVVDHRGRQRIAARCPDSRRAQGHAEGRPSSGACGREAG